MHHKMNNNVSTERGLCKKLVFQKLVENRQGARAGPEIHVPSFLAAAGFAPLPLLNACRLVPHANALKLKTQNSRVYCDTCEQSSGCAPTNSIFQWTATLVQNVTKSKTETVERVSPELATGR